MLKNPEDRVRYRARLELTSRKTAGEPNPASASPAVFFSLPGREPARLELVDAAGRQVVAREVGDRGAGSHAMRLALPSGLRAGLYFLRLVEPGRSSRSLKLVLAR